MVTEIRIYIEGGGDSRSTKDELRGGYRVFLRDLYDLASTKRIRCRVVMCGGRNSTLMISRLLSNHTLKPSMFCS